MIEIDENIDPMVKALKDRKQDFTVVTTNKTKTLLYKEQKFMYRRSKDSNFKPSHLGFMQLIKKEVKERLPLNPVKMKPRQNYYDCQVFADIENGEYLTFENCLEIDINKAYYQALLNMNLLSVETYERFISLPKEIRLALVGSLATRKNTYYYELGELEKHEIKVDKELREVFFCCVDMVDKALKSFKYLQKENFLFYWVDGIYLKDNERIKRDLKIIEARFNFSFSVEPCEKIIFLKCNEYNTKIGVKQGDKNKVFNVENLFQL